MSLEDVGVRISKSLYEQLKKRVDESSGEFKDVDEYVAFVLTQVVKGENESNAYTHEEEQQVKSRLKRLGYI